MPIGSELLSNPNTVSNAAWFKLNCTASGAALNASNTNNVQHLATQAFDFVPTTHYRLYVEADADEVGWIAIVASQVSGANDCLTYFNLSTGAFGTTSVGTGVTAHSRRAWEVSSGRWGIEIIFSGAATPGAGKAITVIYTNADNTPAFVAVVGDGVSIHTISLKTATITADALPYTSIGTLPDADEIGILSYGETYYAQRATECPLTRTTTYYIKRDAAGTKFGGTGAGTVGSPWLCSTIEHVQNLVDSKIAPDVAFSFEGEFYGASVVHTAMLGYYQGVTFKATTGTPLFARATLFSGTFTLSSGTVYTATVPANLAAILRKSAREGAFSKQASSGDVATIPAGCIGSWYQTGTTLYINIGSDPNGIDFELVANNTNNGFETAATGWRFDGCDTVGFGCDSVTPHNQIYHIKFSGSGAKSCLITNWRAYANSTHGPSMNVNTSGGYFCVRDSEAHGAMDSVQTPTMFNAYSANGAHEALFIDCYSNVGEYPTGLTPSRLGALFFGHSNGTAGSFFMAQGCSVGTGAFAPWLGGWENIPARTGFDARAFIVDCTDLYLVTHEHADIAWIGNDLRWSPTTSTNPTIQQTGTNWRGLHINDIITVDRTSTSAPNVALLNKVSGTNDAEFYGCALYLTGAANTTTGYWTSYRELFGEVATGVWANCIVADVTANASTRLGWNNDATKILSNAYWNLADASDAGAGYDQDATKKVLTSAPVVGEAVYRSSPLGPSNPAYSVEYDRDGNLRSLSPKAIGPWATLLEESGQSALASLAGSTSSAVFSAIGPLPFFAGG